VPYRVGIEGVRWTRTNPAGGRPSAVRHLVGQHAIGADDRPICNRDVVIAEVLEDRTWPPFGGDVCRECEARVASQGG